MKEKVQKVSFVHKILLEGSYDLTKKCMEDTKDGQTIRRPVNRTE